jgi:hypothetical protein
VALRPRACAGCAFLGEQIKNLLHAGNQLMGPPRPRSPSVDSRSTHSFEPAQPGSIDIRKDRRGRDILAPD